MPLMPHSSVDIMLAIQTSTDFIYTPFFNSCVMTMGVIACNNTLQISCSVYGNDRQTKECNWTIIVLYKMYGRPIIDTHGRYLVQRAESSVLCNSRTQHGIRTGQVLNDNACNALQSGTKTRSWNQSGGELHDGDKSMADNWHLTLYDH